MRWGNSNLTNWFAGGSRSRELNATRADWNEVEALWQRSPLSENTSSDLALAIVKEAMATSDRVPPTNVLVGLCVATEILLESEDTAPVEADWDLFDRDIAVAVDTRAMLARRRRWASDYPRLMAAFRTQLVDCYRDLFKLFPESRQSSRDGEPLFEVPLLELLDDPAEVVQRHHHDALQRRHHEVRAVRQVPEMASSSLGHRVGVPSFHQPPHCLAQADRSV